MPKNWTVSQLAAITGTGRDLLVSAGAGSGKTAVLTERIIRRLCDDENPADITRMLIVTFTKAAAGELRERIRAALSEAIAKNPGNRRLSRQLLALDRAKICTIHSFCLDLLREFSAECGLGSGFRIADEAEIKLLRKSLMDELIEDYFAGRTTEYEIADFPDFADTFVGTKTDDALAGIFLDIENDLSSFSEHIDFIKNFSTELSADSVDFLETRCGAELAQIVTQRLLSKRRALSEVLPMLLDDPKLSKAYFPAFSGDLAFLDAVEAALAGKCYAWARAVFADFSPVRLGVVRGMELSPEIEHAKELRSELHEERKKLTAQFFSLTPEQIDAVKRDTATLLDKLYTLESAFLDRFTAEKRRRSLVDFGDLERLSYRLLQDTSIAASIAERFDEICIDEYQDTNALQDAIFAAVSNGRNRFMVGDIKQSIYSFRGAEPHIFSEYRSKFGRLDDPELREDEGAALFLSDNFRCDKPVIDFTNLVSRCLFTNGRGDIPFYDEDLLVHSKVGKESGEPVQVVLVDDTDNDSEEASALEARWVASEIAKLIKSGTKDDGTPIKASDIAILMRSAKTHSSVFAKELEAYGVPCRNNADVGFFENAEVLLALCLLQIIDNPTRDIYLAGALRSPVFGFTLDELIRIRRSVPDGCLYDALMQYCDRYDFTKGRRFLETLARWQRRAEGLPVDRLLWYIYSDTDLPALVYDGNAERRANLMLLYEYARRFEASSLRGLYDFLRYVNDILEEKAQFEKASVVSEADDAVKIMTIHQSKGLEFPVCFVCGAGRKFNESDLRAGIVIDRSLGIASKLADSTGFARYDTPIRQAIAKRLSDSQLEEEMRVLYVAMTRARERLYVTAAGDPEKMLELPDICDRSSVMKNGGYMRWILLAMGGCDREFAKIRIVSGSGDCLTTEAEVTEPASCEATPELAALVGERFDFRYPNAAATLPAKLSVSELDENLLDSDAAQLDAPEPDDIEAKRPLFLDAAADDSPTASERGTATHLFMQFCDFSRFFGYSGDLAERVRDEAARLSDRKFITKRAASLVNVYQLSRFFGSPTFAKIAASPHVWREHRFNVKLPASRFTDNTALAGETLLVQGVIDCFFENPDGTLTLIDYKTDFIARDMSADAAAAMLRERHGAQLRYYREAVEKISCRRVSSCVIYSFGLGAEVEIL